jgi:hypothetical protein
MELHVQRSDFNVRIKFDNGVFKVKVNTTSGQRAYELALIDARMGNPLETYAGPVLSWEAVPARAGQQPQREIWNRRLYP